MLQFSNNAWRDLPAGTLEAEFTASLGSIEPVFSNPRLLAAGWREQGQTHIDNLTKPLGSLGRLEDCALQLYCIAALRENAAPRQIEAAPGLLFTVAADHGVAAQGVSPHFQAVTRQMLLNFLQGGAGVNAFCRNAELDFMAVDAGVLGEDFAPHPQLVRAKIAQGSADFTQGPALSRTQCLCALRLGLDLARAAAQQGCRCLAAGEMGIANTTPSSALYCALLGLEPEKSVGAGAGLSPDLLQHKARVVRRALEVNAAALAGLNCSTGPNGPNGLPGLDVLAALGGLEIAVMSGIMLGAAEQKIPMLIDGFIAGAAFLAAWKMAPALADYCVFAHCSAEGAHRAVLEKMGRKPLLDLGLRLGEGSGAALAFSLLCASCRMFNEMASFASAGVNSVL